MRKSVEVNYGTKKQRWLVEDIVCWFMNNHMKRFQSWNIEIDLKNTKKVDGWCMHEEKNDCHIEINKKLKGDDFITCLLHELTHVKQYLTKQLVDKNMFEQLWKGESYINIGGQDYFNLPWEKEAYEQQELLLKEWKIERDFIRDRAA